MDKKDEHLDTPITDSDDSSTEAATKVGGATGATVGAVAGALIGGPLGAVAGAAIGGALGGATSGAAINAMNPDEPLSDIGQAAREVKEGAQDTLGRAVDKVKDVVGNAKEDVVDDQPGVQTGGTVKDGSPDTRGILEKAADTVTGDNVVDETGKPVK